MTRGEQTEFIFIVSQVETTDSDVSSTSRTDGDKRKVAAKVETLSGEKSFQSGLDPIALNARVSTFSKVKSSDEIEWRGMKFRIVVLTPKFERYGTYYEIIISSQDVI